MSVSFYGNELINIAIGIESSGIAFYELMARSTKNRAARDIFQHLAGMERNHIEIFHNMLSEIEKEEHPEVYAGDYAAFLQALADTAVFTPAKGRGDGAMGVETDIAAVNIGIGAEKDSILFYLEMKEKMPAEQRPMIESVINEEKLHLRQLAEFKKKLKS